MKGIKMICLSPSPEILPFIKQVVGYVRVNKEFFHHNNNYECAAWWEDTKIQTGIYPLILSQSHFSSKELYLSTKFSATVVDDYFPALWGGVAVSNTPYRSTNMGANRQINHRFEIVESIIKTGNSPDNDFDLFINPMMWDMFVRLAEHNLINAHNSYNIFWNDYKNNAEDRFISKSGMVAHCAEQVSNIARAIQEMKRCIANFNQDSDYYNELRDKNTSWVLKAA